jgi:hypothetical protein
MARTAAEIQVEIDSITLALAQIRVAGQSYEITSGSGAGTKRVVTMADYDTLKQHRNDLISELSEVNSTRAVRIRPAW